MARMEIAVEVLEDFDRFVAHMRTFVAGDVDQRFEEIIEAIEVLGHSPELGRPARGAKRELVIGTGARGYVVLYRYVKRVEMVFVLAVRAQREARCKRRRGTRASK